MKNIILWLWEQATCQKCNHTQLFAKHWCYIRGYSDGTEPDFSSFICSSSWLFHWGRSCICQQASHSRSSDSCQATHLSALWLRNWKTNQPSSPTSSGYALGLQFSWQNVSEVVCLEVKWKTSTVRPISSKKLCCLTIFASEQLLSKKMW